MYQPTWLLTGAALKYGCAVINSTQQSVCLHRPYMGSQVLKQAFNQIRPGCAERRAHPESLPSFQKRAGCTAMSDALAQHSSAYDTGCNAHKAHTPLIFTEQSSMHLTAYSSISGCARELEQGLYTSRFG